MNKFFKALYILRYYLLTVLLCTILLVLLNVFVFSDMVGLSKTYLALASVLEVIGVIAIDALCAILFHKLPKKLVAPERKYLHVAKWEKKFYNFIRIKKWKDKIPEIGALACDFGKDKIEDPNDPEYIYEFLLETGYAEVIHVMSCILGFALLLVDVRIILIISLPVAIINICFNILSALIQRYNRPKLLALYERRLRLSKSK